jgi:hypothetical protein
VPVRVTAGLPGGEEGVVREVSCGESHTVVAMASGEVCTCGFGSRGQLGARGRGGLADPEGVATVERACVARWCGQALRARATRSVSNGCMGVQYCVWEAQW